MADQVEIHYQSLTTCADGHRDAAGRTDEVDQLRQGATLPAGSLGKLPQGPLMGAFRGLAVDLGPLGDPPVVCGLVAADLRRRTPQAVATDRVHPAPVHLPPAGLRRLPRHGSIDHMRFLWVTDWGYNFSHFGFHCNPTDPIKQGVFSKTPRSTRWGSLVQVQLGPPLEPLMSGAIRRL